LADSIAQQFPFLEVSLETPEGRPVHRSCPFFRKDSDEDERQPRFFRAFCDNCKCKIPFPGSRFKCNTCPDFDLCSKCSAIKDIHNPNHKFVEIKHPRDILHNALCDSCGNFIVGDRHKCLTCPDFDLCTTCRQKPSIHPEGHNFEKLERPIRRCTRFNRYQKVALPVSTPPAESKMEEEQPKAPIVNNVQKTEVKEEKIEVKDVKKEEVKEVAKESKKEEIVPIAPVAPVAPVVEKIDPFTAKLNQLNDMGFTNRERNIALLMRHKGDLVAVVKDLLF